MRKERSTGTHIARVVFSALIFLLSVVTTILFFADHFTLFPPDPPWVNVLVGAGMGALTLDVGALVWLWIYRNGTDNMAERTLAQIGFGTCLAGSALTSFLHLFLSTNLITLPDIVNPLSAVALAGMIVLNFVLVTMLSYSSTEATIDQELSKMRANATDQMLAQMEKQLERAIPTLARERGDEMARRFAASFRSPVLQLGDGGDPETAIQVTGDGEEIRDRPYPGSVRDKVEREEHARARDNGRYPTRPE